MTTTDTSIYRIHIELEREDPDGYTYENTHSHCFVATTCPDEAQAIFYQAVNNCNGFVADHPPE